jgi:RES domain-containing protein
MRGGRWTSRGRSAIYCAEHLSLALLEVLVHISDPDERSALRVRYRLQLDDSLVEPLPEGAVPDDFSPRTPYGITQPLGDDWLERADTPALSVPSAIVPMERNYLLNPLHPRFRAIAWDSGEPIVLDERLWVAGGRA